MGKRKKILPILDRDKDSNLDWLEDDKSNEVSAQEVSANEVEILTVKKSVTKVPGKKRKFM